MNKMLQQLDTGIAKLSVEELSLENILLPKSEAIRYRCKQKKVKRFAAE
jgi:hypothetical protein